MIDKVHFTKAKIPPGVYLSNYEALCRAYMYLVYVSPTWDKVTCKTCEKVRYK